MKTIKMMETTMKDKIKKIVDNAVGMVFGVLSLSLVGLALLACDIAMVKVIVKMIGG